MADVRFAQATGAYQDALRAAERILERAGAISANAEAPQISGPSFLDMVGDSLQSAAAKGYKSEAMAVQAIAGKADLADVVTAVTDAETALNTVVAIRDKVIGAYQDIIRMPI
jgi:flagellar hook-basal body complex protein FliE